MFREPRVNVPVLGLVENMAWFTPAPHPEEKYYIFGNGGGVRLCQEIGIDLLGQIPLVADVCVAGDAGAPVAVAAEGADRPDVAAFDKLADSIVAAVNDRNKLLPPTQKVEMKH